MADLQFPQGFRMRRFLNWFFMGLAYAFLYWGRYDLNRAKTSLGDLMTNQDFGLIFGVGTAIYAFSFLVNGPLTDKYGGRRMMLISVAGSCVMNGLMGLILNKVLVAHAIPQSWLTPLFAGLYGINMYFQSIGAVAIVHVNANWFHISERGRFGGWFGAMISMGLFFAFDISTYVLHFAEGAGPGGMDAKWWVFWAPSLALAAIFVLESFLLRDRPSGAGFTDIDTGTAAQDPNEKPPPVLVLFKSVLQNKVLMIVAFIGICTGALRDGMMQWVPIFAKTPVANGGLGLGPDAYLNAHWGLQLMIAGIVGPMAGGWARDKVFQSRCGPPAALFYGILITATIAMCFLLRMPIVLAVICFCMSLSYIGSQGLLTSTAAMDFGGKAKATATGVIDGFVYIGSTVESLCLGWLTTSGSTTTPPTSTAQGWSYYPIFLVPFAVIGFILAVKIWSATADRQPVKGATAH